MISEIELGVVGTDVVAIFQVDQEEIREAMTIDEIRQGLLGMNSDDYEETHFLRVAAAVLSALEAEHINCYSEPSES